MEPYVIPLAELGMNDVEVVGGKNASLGEMISNLSEVGVAVPGGFATTAAAYRDFLAVDGLDGRIKALLDNLDVDDIDALTAAGKQIRGWILEAPLPPKLTDTLKSSWDELTGNREIAVAVRSSATAEDLPDASFAGQQSTYLNIRGGEMLLTAIRSCFASLFTDRAISYRSSRGFDHFAVKLSVCVQKMVRSDLGVSGVAFSLDTESGFKDVVLINGAYGLGELVVGGK